MISNVPHCHYRNNPLAEVICQLRFPEILAIDATPPAEFQNRIGDKFPLFQKRMEIPALKSGQILNHQSTNHKPFNNYQFSSTDGIWRINLTRRFISLSCSQYSCWEDFAANLDQILVSFIQVYRPAYFDRIGLRYVNFVSRINLGLENIPFRELFSSCYLGPLALEHVSESDVSKATVDFDVALREGIRAKIHAGPGIVTRNGVRDNEVKFIFDQDLYMAGSLPLNQAAGYLSMLHTQAWGLFRGAITNPVHTAMKPE